MTTPNPPAPKPESGIIRGLKSLQRDVVRMLNVFFNIVFGLTHGAAGWRSYVVIGLFFAAIVASALLHMTFQNWLTAFAEAFTPTVRASSLAVEQNITPIQFLLQNLFSFDIIRTFFFLLIPYFLAHHIAGIYQADIFEKELAVCKKFIMQAAFADTYNTIHIREGKVIPGDQNSPIIQIGGPGYVIVELDSAALFEKADGTCHVVGPTGDMPRQRIEIDDFERLRKAIDLRDQSDNANPGGRSKEGIKVSVKDVQFIYSIYRGYNPPTPAVPYPFTEDAVKNRVYKSTVMVQPGKPGKDEPEWKSPGPGKIYAMINGFFGGFISSRGLSDFLTTIGEPEEQAFRSREERIHNASDQLAGANGGMPESVPGAVSGSKDFIARSELTRDFYAEKNVQGRAGAGISIHWLGVGTWDTPAENLREDHKKAWQLSRENRSRSNEDFLGNIEKDARLQEILRLIQQIPVAAYRSLNRQPLDKAVDEMLKRYMEQLGRARDLYRNAGEKVPQELEFSLDIFEKFYGVRDSYDFGNESQS
jgi:hypothetical protein